MLCDSPVEVPLRDHVWQLLRDFGARGKFVRGVAEQCLPEEFHGVAGVVRW